MATGTLAAPRNGAADVLDRSQGARRPDQGIEVMEGFQGSAGDVGTLALHAGTAAGIAREESEIKAAIVLARSAPRDENAAYTKIIKSCDRPSFAERARYSFPRGRQQIEGPSVALARAIALCWGNIRSGIRIVTMDDQMVHVKGYAYDLETNAYVDNEAKFSRLIQRKDRESGITRWVPADERDLRELVNKHGAICVRNSILQTVPPDVVEDAMGRVRETIRKAAAGELKQDRQGAIRRLVLAFADLQVTTEMLTDHLGHDLDLITDEEMADLRGVFASIRDGNSRRDEHFTIPGAAAKELPAGGSKTDQVAAKMANKRGAAKGADVADAPAEPKGEQSKQAAAATTAKAPDFTGKGADDAKKAWSSLCQEAHNATGCEGEALFDLVAKFIDEQTPEDRDERYTPKDLGNAVIRKRLIEAAASKEASDWKALALSN